MAICRVLARSRAFQQRSLSTTALTLGHVRKLDDIVKVDLLECEPAPIVKRIWEDYHKGTEQSWGITLDAPTYETMRGRLAESPMFIAPVTRGKGFFTMAMQAKEKSLCFTFLEEFKKRPETAVPWLFATVHDDLVHSKGLALLRADFLPHVISKEESATAISRLISVYTTDKYDRAWIFNHAPHRFDVAAYLRDCGCALETSPSSTRTAS